ncbi:choice-of-anchor I family protein [Fibrobacter succinogenes]|uniref:choice-of-anchor I family protein n=1 Tax=Fibrobacter succinogenes TaxID=833 RepID=UPI0013D878FA|nr:choice-of-anchor I family protein [Fibrobacter succinogenes]
MNKILLSASLLLCAGFCFAKNAVPAGPFQWGHTLKPLSTTKMSTAEISAYMPAKKKLFVVGDANVVEVVDLSNPSEAKKISEVQIPGNASSVTVHGDLVAVSMLEVEEWRNGQVQVMRYTDNLEVLGLYTVCSQPDMIKFTPDGKNLLVACEGSPSTDFAVDPDGGIGFLTVAKADAESWKTAEFAVAGFDHLDTNRLKNAGVRAPGNQGFLKSLEPEYITVSDDSKLAWVSLQENNAMAIIDVPAKKIKKVFPLGFVDHSRNGFAIDAVSDGKIDIKNYYPLRGLRQPDGIAAFTAGDRHFVLTANEGAPVNDYKAWTDVTSVQELVAQGRLDETVFTEKITTDLKDLSVSALERCDEGKYRTHNGKCPYAYTFGSRSVSIFDGETGKLLWDSGEMFERVLAKIAPEYFNWNSKKGKAKMDKRSSDKGCEPENVTVGEVGRRRYAFAGLERSSGIAVFDVTDPEAPKLVDYYLDPLDRGPEGVLFISADDSPMPGQALLVVGYEYSKTLTIYTIK